MINHALKMNIEIDFIVWFILIMFYTGALNLEESIIDEFHHRKRNKL